MVKLMNVSQDLFFDGYNNFREWLNDDNNIYIGRRGLNIMDIENSNQIENLLALPFKIKKNDNKNILNRYNTYLRERIKDNNFKNKLLSLKDKTLGCFCENLENCHGNIIVNLVEELSVKENNNKKKNLSLYDKEIKYKYFNSTCYICNNYCDEISGWKCVKCLKSFCLKHNNEDYTCNCI